MADIAFRMEQPMAVEVFEGGYVVAWSVTEDGQVALVFDPSAADETGRRLRETARREAGADIPAGHVAKVGISPPTSVHEPADLVLAMSDGRSLTLTIPLDALAQLARTAEVALAAVAPDGRA